MADAILSRALMRERGGAAFLAGQSRDSHNMNWHAVGLPDWLKGYDAAAQSHDAIQAAMRVDAAQGHS